MRTLVSVFLVLLRGWRDRGARGRCSEFLAGGEHRVAERHARRPCAVARRASAGRRRSRRFQGCPLRHGHRVSGAGRRKSQSAAVGGRCAQGAERSRALGEAAPAAVVELLAARASGVYALQRAHVHHPERGRGGDPQEPEQRSAPCAAERAAFRRSRSRRGTASLSAITRTAIRWSSIRSGWTIGRMWICSARRTRPRCTWSSAGG